MADCPAGRVSRDRSRLIRNSAIVAALLAFVHSSGASPASAQDKPLGWGEEKCARYAKAWSEALRRKGAQGLGSEFVQRHDAFLASGCALGIQVCPRSPEELDMANIMIIAAFNAGMASTFTPFTCRK
jgi:uncharacterized membrane protein